MVPIRARGPRWAWLSCLIWLGCAQAESGSTGQMPGGTDGSNDGAIAGGSCDEPTEREGEGTYYAADGSGNCSFDPSPDDLLVAAINEDDYQGSAACGTCVRVEGPNGSVDVRIVDRCPECPAGDLDLSPQAFERIAPLEAGRVPITWTRIPCPVAGPLRYRFKEGSSQWWTAIQVRNCYVPDRSGELRSVRLTLVA